MSIDSWESLKSFSGWFAVIFWLCIKFFDLDHWLYLLVALGITLWFAAGGVVAVKYRNRRLERDHDNA